MKVVIIGAGVAGLAIGWRLSQAGCEVEVLERGLAGRASSWAAAGMLAATAETLIHNHSYSGLARAGRTAWPEFASELEKASEIRLGYRQCGSLLIAQTLERSNDLQAMAQKLSALGEDLEWQSAEEARAREPLLGPSVKAALYARNDAQVDNRQLSAALARALVRSGGTLREQCDVCALDVKSGVISGVTTTDQKISADKVVIAAGAWSSKIGGVDKGVLPPVRPAKGQMAAMAPPSGVGMPSSLIWGEKTVYLVPRIGTLLIGATVEDVGYETSVTREAITELVARASQIIPSLSSWRIVESWAGLRPRTPDDSPVLGATSVPGLFVASGQYRNGILFAPLLADMICDLVLEKSPDPLFDEFSPMRFVQS